MDFSKFRTSGDLSDIIVAVEGNENKLHKFPLYARSDYFCDMERESSGGENGLVRIELENFPGGNTTFETVADFCYNMHINIDNNNAVAIRCSSQYLRMNGPGNLIDVSEKFIQDFIATAKLNQSNGAILSLLMDANVLGETARSSGIVDLCVDAFVHCLTKILNKYIPISFGNSPFSKVTPKYKREENANFNLSTCTKVQSELSTTTPVINQSQEMLDDKTMSDLVSIQSEWFALILQRAKEKGIAISKLATLAVRYVTSAIDKDNSTNSTSESEPPVANGSQEYKEMDRECGKKKDTTVNVSANSSLKTSVQSENIDIVLDNVILSLPEHAYGTPCVTMEWLTKVLQIATARECKCRGHLVKVAGEILCRLGPEDLSIISPSVLHDIVKDANGPMATESGNEDIANLSTVNIHRERACKLVDTYLGQLRSKCVLTAETFRLLASATKEFPRESHDFLFDILQYVLDAEAEKLTPTLREELVGVVDFGLVHETNLQKALESKIAAPEWVARSAIKLCTKLRSECESVKYNVQKQYQSLATTTTKTDKPSPRDSPPLLKDPSQYMLPYHCSERPSTGLVEVLESETKSPTIAITDHPANPNHSRTDTLRAARRKLALPVYTGYSPSHAHTTGLQSPINVGQSRAAFEYDRSLEGELELRFDRSFRSLDPRVRHHHIRTSGLKENTHQFSPHNTHDNSSHTYFSYTSPHNRKKR